MLEAITITITGTLVERTGQVVVVLRVVEVAMADVEDDLARADQDPPARASIGVHQQVMDKGAHLLFQWSIYATLTLVDDPAMLAIIFT